MDFTNMIENMMFTNSLPVIKKQNGLYYTCALCLVKSYSTDEDTGTVTLKFSLMSSGGVTVTGTFDSSNSGVLNWIRSNLEVQIIE